MGRRQESVTVFVEGSRVRGWHGYLLKVGETVAQFSRPEAVVVLDLIDGRPALRWQRPESVRARLPNQMVLRHPAYRVTGERATPIIENGTTVEGILGIIGLPGTICHRWSADEIYIAEERPSLIGADPVSNLEQLRNDGEFSGFHSRWISDGTWQANEVRGGTFAMLVTRSDRGRGFQQESLRFRVDDLFVRPDANITVLSRLLSGLVFGRGAPENMVEALCNLDIAKQAVAACGISRNDGDLPTVIVGDSRFPLKEAVQRRTLATSFGDPPSVWMERLFRRHGVRLFSQVLTEEDLEILGAVLTAERAADWILKNYAVQAVTRGDKVHVRLGVRGPNEIEWCELDHGTCVHDPRLSAVFSLYDNIAYPEHGIAAKLRGRASETVHLAAEQVGASAIYGQSSGTFGWQGHGCAAKSQVLGPTSEWILAARWTRGESLPQEIRNAWKLLSPWNVDLLNLDRVEIVSALDDGGRAMIGEWWPENEGKDQALVVNLASGEEKEFILVVRLRNGGKKSVWGVKIRRTGDTLTFSQPDTTARYAVEGPQYHEQFRRVR